MVQVRTPVHVKRGLQKKIAEKKERFHLKKIVLPDHLLMPDELLLEDPTPYFFQSLSGGPFCSLTTNRNTRDVLIKKI